MKHPTQRLLTAMILGFTAGLIAKGLVSSPEVLLPWITGLTKPIGTLFIRLILMLVIPLLVSALIIGVLEAGSGDAHGKMGIRTLIIVVILSGLSVLIGLGLVNWVQPGKWVPREALQAMQHTLPPPSESKGFWASVLEIVPTNPLKEAAFAFDPQNSEGGILAVMFFALFIGIAMLGVPEEQCRPVREFFQSLFSISQKGLHLILKMAPLAVACFLFNLGAQLGLEGFRMIGIYVAVVLGALLLHGVGVYSLVLIFGARQNPIEFFKKTSDALLMAFSTSSSNATLPKSLEVAEFNLKLPKSVSRFVLTIGASANQNGTALFEGVTILFLAQAYGIPLSFAQQLQVAGLCILAGVGTAGVPSASIPFIAAVGAGVGIPLEGVTLILGVDRFLDMCRTTVNVGGDLVVAAVVARGYKEAKTEI
ncbi:MAG: dicarboxylate/amino acid:cation symporter [Verrucomicrobiota bacterium]